MSGRPVKVTIEALTPVDESVQWALHDAYWKQRGAAAWDSGEVPTFSTSNYATARLHAGFFQTLVVNLQARGLLGAHDPVYVLEGGCGTGKFAACFLSALTELDGPTGLVDRIRYVLSDYSEANVREAIGRAPLDAWYQRGTIIPALYDLRAPMRVHPLDGRTFDERLTLFISSYVCCVLPMKHLQKRGDDWFELMVEISAELEPGVSRKHFVRDLTGDATRENLLEDLERRFEWSPIDLDERFDGTDHPELIRSVIGDLDDATLGYPYGYVDFLDEVQPLLAPGGVVITNDYGNVRVEGFTGHYERRLQIYGNSLAQDVNFTIFDVHAALRGAELMRTDDVLNSIHTAVLSHTPLGGRLRRFFADNYQTTRVTDDLLDFHHVGKSLQADKDYERALRFFLRCIELDPENLDVLYRIGEVALDANHQEIALKYLARGHQLDSQQSMDFDFQLGRAYALDGASDQAVYWYEVSNERSEHPVTYTNLGVIHTHEGRFQEAYRVLNRALELDPTYDRARDRLAKLKEHVWESTVGSFEDE